MQLQSVLVDHYNQVRYIAARLLIATRLKKDILALELVNNLLEKIAELKMCFIQLVREIINQQVSVLPLQ